MAVNNNSGNNIWQSCFQVMDCRVAGSFLNISKMTLII